MKNLFYKPLKIRHPNEDILVWGCPHLDQVCKDWDTPLYAQRGYETLEDHNNALIYNWNSKSSDTTIGFLLGDVMFGKGGKEKFEGFLDRLKFEALYIMPGNHHAGWKQSFESAEENIVKLGDKTIIFTPNYLEAFINGQAVVMSHYPILSYNGMGKGSWMLFSHVHNKLELSKIGWLYKNSGLKVYETSVECNEYPVTIVDIREHMKKQNGGSVDGHDKHTNNPF